MVLENYTMNSHMTYEALDTVGVKKVGNKSVQVSLHKGNSSKDDDIN